MKLRRTKKNCAIFGPVFYLSKCYLLYDLVVVLATVIPTKLMFLLASLIACGV